MQLVPGDDRAVRHICIRCIHWLKIKKLQRCWKAMNPGTGHLPSFFVPNPGNLDSFCVPTRGNLPIFQIKCQFLVISLGVMGTAGID